MVCGTLLGGRETLHNKKIYSTMKILWNPFERKNKKNKSKTVADVNNFTIFKCDIKVNVVFCFSLIEYFQSASLNIDIDILFSV